MKFSMVVPCACGNKTIVYTSGDEAYPDVQCNNCGQAIWVIDDGRISRRAISRAEVELVQGDGSLSIILSAMSVECELAHLLLKWKDLDAELGGGTPPGKEIWEREFRKLPGGIGGKLDCVAKLLTQESLSTFLARRNDLLTLLREKHQNVGSRAWKDFFTEELFYKRNSILHSGEVRYGGPEGEACFRMACSLLHVIDEMDKERYARFDQHLQSLRGRTGSDIRTDPLH